MEMERLDTVLEFGSNWSNHCMDIRIDSSQGHLCGENGVINNAVLQNLSATEFDGQVGIWALSTAPYIFKSRIICTF